MPPLSAFVLAIASANPLRNAARRSGDRITQTSAPRDVEKDGHGEHDPNSDSHMPRTFTMDTTHEPDDEDEDGEMDDTDVEGNDADGRSHRRQDTRDDTLTEDGGNAHPEGVHRRTGRFPRVNTGTSFGSSVSQLRFLRPSLPSWLISVKKFLFGSSYPKNDLSASSTSPFTAYYRTMPIISGVLMPFAIMLEIPGIIEHWYIRTDGANIVQTKKNTVLLDVGLALSMACAVVANAAILIRFLERRVKSMTILAASFLTIHDIINIVAVMVFGVEHRFNDGFTYGEAYWLTACSTIISIVTNITLLWDLFTIPNFENSGSGITRKQRSLVIITITFLTYTSLGALLTSLLMELTFLDGLYFTLVTLLTIGFGDIHPNNAVQRAIVCLYTAVGILILGGAIRLISEAVMEGLEMGYLERLQKFKRERKERKREEKETKKWIEAIEKMLQDQETLVWISESPSRQRDALRRPNNVAPNPPQRGRARSRSVGGSGLRRASLYISSTMGGGGEDLRLNTAALSDEQLEQAANIAGVPLEKYRYKKIMRSAAKVRREESRSRASLRIPSSPMGLQDVDAKDEDLARRAGVEDAPNIVAPVRTESPVPSGSSRAGDTLTSSARSSIVKRMMEWSMDWWKQAYEKVFRTPEEQPAGFAKTLEKQKKREMYVRLTVAWTLFFIFWICGAAIFAHTEGWPVGTGLYFCFVAFTSIGYGDFSPLTPVGRAIFVFWSILGVCAMTILISVISDAFSSKYEHMTQDRSFEKAISKYHRSKSSHHSGKNTTGPVWSSFSTNPRISRPQARRPSHHERSSVPIIVTSPPASFVAPVDETGSQGRGELSKVLMGGLSSPSRIAIAPALEDHLARISTSNISHPSTNRNRSLGAATPISRVLNLTLRLPVRTIEEADAKIKERTEDLPDLILHHVQNFRQHLRYFLVTNGHTAGGLAEAMASVGEPGLEQGADGGPGTLAGMSPPKEMRQILDEIAAQEGIGEGFKEEVWQDTHARNTLFVLGIETGIRRLMDAASEALQIITERERLREEVDQKLAAGPVSALDAPSIIDIRMGDMSTPVGPHFSRVAEQSPHTTVYEEELEQAGKQDSQSSKVEHALQENIVVDVDKTLGLHKTGEL